MNLRKLEQKALAIAKVMGMNVRKVGEVGAKDAVATVLDDDDEAGAGGVEGVGAGVEGRETDAMLVEGVDEVPGFLDLETGREHQTDLLGEFFGEDAFCR